MEQRFNITDIVKAAQRKTELPERFADLDEKTKEILRRKARAADTTPEELYAVIRAQRAKDLHPEGNGFDPDVIAKAALAR
ncbi:hypothetical protein [Paenarthrobacter ureafaciens]|uniref:hypothetical protein n=1 Tax=Paenarthrobacter ureafaciens TaxID=37931 RepID=UPI003CEB1468